MKKYEGVEAQVHPFLASALDGNEWWVHATADVHLGKEPLVPI
jgi:hypothetical protein